MVLIYLFRSLWSWQQDYSIQFLNLIISNLHLFQYQWCYAVLFFLRVTPFTEILLFSYSNAIWNGFHCFLLRHLIVGFYFLLFFSVWSLFFLSYQPKYNWFFLYVYLVKFFRTFPSTFSSAFFIIHFMYFLLSITHTPVLQMILEVLLLSIRLGFGIIPKFLYLLILCYYQ